MNTKTERELVADVERLQKQWDRLGFDFPDQWKNPCFGFAANEGETLRQAIQRWYIEFDNVRSEQYAKIVTLREALEFYAKEPNWRGACQDDNGSLARDAIDRTSSGYADNRPKTHDGVRVNHGDTLFMGPHGIGRNIHEPGSEIVLTLAGGYEGEVSVEDCYSTKAAALAAKETDGQSPEET